MIEKLKIPNSKKILVIGDVIQDHYVYGKVDRISPEAPIPIVTKTSSCFKLGGAANVYKNLLALGAKCDIISVIGPDPAGIHISNELRSNQNGYRMLYETDKITPVKTRIIADEQHLLRIDDETSSPISTCTAETIIEYFDSSVDDICLVVLSDYGKGVLLNTILPQYIIEKCTKLNIPVLVDPHNGAGDFLHYTNATMIKANKKQIKMLNCSSPTIEQSLQLMISKFNLEMGMITLSEDGLILKLANEPATIHRFSNVVREISDVTGAGDSAMATFAYGISVGLSSIESAKLANLAGNISVQHPGTYSVTIKDLETQLNGINKIISIDTLKDIKTESNKVVFVNGCFDLLHPGHVALLEYSKKRGDILVVGLNSDESVKFLKGNKRPIINQNDRAKMLAALGCVDYVYIFSDSTPQAIINVLRPDVHVKGNDHHNETDGVPTTLFFDRIEEYSTTKIIENQ